VSARHQVKRLDRPFEEFALSKTGPAEETSFLRSVRIFKVRNFTGIFAPVKSGPDVFADALVPPGTPSFPAGTDDAWRFRFSQIPTSTSLFEPRRAVRNCIVSRTRCSAASGARDRFHGYRFAKWQGKPNSANQWKRP
jgi:hypothetical protein